MLHHGAVAVWESLAICEYLAETFPEAGRWPADKWPARAHRPRRRDRDAWRLPPAAPPPPDEHPPPAASPRDLLPDVEADIDRVCAIWRDSRARFGAGGEFLFGRFSIADAMYALVVTRFHTYQIVLSARWKPPIAPPR